MVVTTACGTLSCVEQYRAMAFAQLTFPESLRDIESCLSAQASKLYHMGFRNPVRRSTLADANETLDWRIYAEFAQRLYTYCIRSVPSLLPAPSRTSTHQTIALAGIQKSQHYPEHLRRIRFKDPAARRWCFSPTSACCRSQLSAPSINVAGMSTCFLSGSNSTCRSRGSMGPRKTR
jgi:Domain of unknown function (DUF4372)